MQRYGEHFRLAHELKMHLHTFMGWSGPMTHRQFKAWQQWQRLERNVPSKDNAYQMQIACEVRRVLAQHPGNIKVNDFAIKFENGSKKREGMSKEQISRNMTARFMVMAGGKPIRGLNAPLPEGYKIAGRDDIKGGFQAMQAKSRDGGSLDGGG